MLEASPFHLVLSKLAFALVLCIGLAVGIRARIRDEKKFATRWTRDTVLLSWEQRATHLWEEDSLGVILTLDNLLTALLYVGVPCFLVLSNPGSPAVAWSAAVLIGLPGILAGQLLYKHLGLGRTLRWVSILDTGLIFIGIFFPWAEMSHFTVDPQRRSIRLCGRSPAGALMEVLLPPDREQLDRAVELLGAHLPAAGPALGTLPGPTKATWELRWLGLLLLKMAWAVIPVLFLRPETAALVLGIGFYLLTRLSLSMHRAMMRRRIEHPGDGLAEIRQGG